MTTSSATAQAQWLEQLAGMRRAIAELNLPVGNGDLSAYGSDMNLDDEMSSGATSSDDVWDLVDEGIEEDYSSDSLDYAHIQETQESAYDRQWLIQKCRSVTRTASSVDAAVLEEQIVAVLASDSSGPSPCSWSLNHGSWTHTNTT